MEWATGASYVGAEPQATHAADLRMELRRAQHQGQLVVPGGIDAAAAVPTALLPAPGLPRVSGIDGWRGRLARVPLVHRFGTVHGAQLPGTSVRRWHVRCHPSRIGVLGLPKTLLAVRSVFHLSPAAALRLVLLGLGAGQRNRPVHGRNSRRSAGRVLFGSWLHQGPRPTCHQRNASLATVQPQARHQVGVCHRGKKFVLALPELSAGERVHQRTPHVRLAIRTLRRP